MKGVLNLYKPKGITSSGAVAFCRKILGTKAVGHMGTLDPAGEGVLLLGVGKATRLFDYYLQKDKVYEAEFSFGFETDTLDGDGTETKRCASIPTQVDLLRTIPRFLGKQEQVPPCYSAKNINGVRSYKLAREGKETMLAACPVEIFDLRLLRQTSENTYLFAIHCSSGTYIRSLCRDMAYAVGSLGTMTAIKRMRCGRFHIQDSVTFDDLKDRLSAALIPVEDAIGDLPVFMLADSYFTSLCNGIKIPAQNDWHMPFALYCRNTLFGIARNENGFIRIGTYLRD